MGRITVFSTQDCRHCIRAKAALERRRVPFVDVDLNAWPDRRKDMLNLCDKMSVPQVWFNENRVGGCDDLLRVLDGWDAVLRTSGTVLSHEQLYHDEVGRHPDPTDPRLRLPPPSKSSSSDSGEETKNGKQQQNRSKQNRVVPLPEVDGEDDGDGGGGRRRYASVSEMMRTLDEIFDQRDRPYNCHVYKSCFVNTEGVTALQNRFRLRTRADAVEFGRMLQQKFKLLDHVCGDHLFRDDGYYFFRLQCYATPDVLNSYRIWRYDDDDENDTEEDVDVDAVIHNLKNLLNRVTTKATDPKTGLVDYVAAAQDKEHYPLFEDAVCQLQGTVLYGVPSP